MKLLVKVGNTWDLSFKAVNKYLNRLSSFEPDKLGMLRKKILKEALSNKKFMEDYLEICKTEIYPSFTLNISLNGNSTSFVENISYDKVIKYYVENSSDLKGWQKNIYKNIVKYTSDAYTYKKLGIKEIHPNLTYINMLQILISSKKDIVKMIENNNFNNISGEEFYMLVVNNYENKYLVKNKINNSVGFDSLSIDRINQNIDLIRYYYEPNLIKDEPFTPSRNIADEFTLNDKIKNAVLSDMPKNLNDLQKTYYIYKRLCQMFSYDEDYFYYTSILKEDEQAKKPVIDHTDISRLNDIDINSDVICTEVSMLFAKFLDMMNVPYQITDYHNRTKISYEKSHMKVRFKLGEYIIEADAAHGLYSSDLSIEKVYGRVRHFKPIGMLPERIRDDVFDELLEVDEYFKNTQIRHEFNDAKEIYENDYKKNPNIRVEDKVIVLLNMIGRVNLKFMDMFDWVRANKKQLFANDPNSCILEFIINKNPVKEDKNYELAMAIMYNDKGDVLKDLNDNKYLIITADKNVESLDYTEIKRRFKNDIYDFTSSDRRAIFEEMDGNYERENNDGYKI